jgi:hypothetical protein
MGIENISVINEILKSQLADKFGFLITIIQAVGGLIVIYIVLYIINILLNIRKNRLLKKISDNVEAINKKLSKKK